MNATQAMCRANRTAIAGISSKLHYVLRGGAFNNNQNNVRCSARNNNDPDNRNNNIGFRVVLSTWVAGNVFQFNG